MRDTVAVYIRLSLEDGDLCSGEKEESESVTNQRRLLHEYIRTSAALCDDRIIEFCDDGYSGKNFERPGFKRMIEEARAGGIQCIVVKDLSRFGRDYITVGNYISRVFPFLGVRLISVNDNFDSSRKGDIDSLDTSFKTLIYDMYSRDLSQKVKSAKKQLVERGVYINPVAPFGYRKPPDDKHMLVPDPAAAETVKRIFTMAVEGSGTREIAMALNKESIPTPSAHKRGTPSAHASWPEDGFWTRKMVHEIIRERQYAGSLVWGKRVRPQIGSPSQLTTRAEDRFVQDNHHEPLVSIELYEAAQTALGGPQRRNARYIRGDYPLRGKVYCGACGRKILRKAKKEPYYRCDTPLTLPGAACCQGKVYEQELVELVTELIQKQSQYAVDAQRLMAARRVRTAARERELKTMLQRLEGAYAQMAKQGERLYEKLADGALTRECYLREKSAVLRRQEESEARMEALRQELRTITAAQSCDAAQLDQYARLDNLTSKIYDELVERVTIFPDGVIDVRLNYADELAAILEANKADTEEGA